jgi:hypothetical protein
MITTVVRHTMARVCKFRAFKFEFANIGTAAETAYFWAPRPLRLRCKEDRIS